MADENQRPAAPDWKTAYEEVCRQHDGIAGFRAQLLGLLPLASGGAGIFLLFSDELESVLPHLLAIGGFGFLVALGLFWYELRGIQKCIILIICGEALEARLLKANDGPAAFSVRQGGVRPFWPNSAQKSAQSGKERLTVGAEGAALIIYPTVLGGWTYIASIGFLYHIKRFMDVTDDPAQEPSSAMTALVDAAIKSMVEEQGSLLAVLAAIIVTGLSMIWGSRVRKKQRELSGGKRCEIRCGTSRWLNSAEAQGSSSTNGALSADPPPDQPG